MQDQINWREIEYIENNWLTMSDAAALYSKEYKISYRMAKRNIIELIVDGRLQMRCRRSIYEADIGIIKWNINTNPMVHPGRIGRSFKKEYCGKGPPIPIGCNFFSQKYGWKIDDAKTDWGKGVIVAKQRLRLLKKNNLSNNKLYSRRAAKGLLILKESLQIGISLKRENPRCNGGVEISNNKQKRPRLYPKLIEIADDMKCWSECDINKKFGDMDTRGFRAGIIREILKNEDILETEISYATVSREVDKVIRSWRARGSVRSV